MSARYIIGDTRDVLATLPDGSIDLVMTSPPFLALRSYLPADHPDKHREIGSEPDPATFLQTLLELTADWGRVLAPHGSICVELGDTYSGSGGGGGDYLEGGIREGQQQFAGSGATMRESNAAHWRAKAAAKDRWPLPKSLCGIPHLYHLSLTYGRNLLTGEESPAGRWRVRNVVAWCRPNPPVGALGDKFRPATSYMTIACREGSRYFDLDAVRDGNYSPRSNAGKVDARDIERAKVGLSSGKPGKDNNPNGAPPLDYWVIPTQPYSGSHYAVYPPALVERPIKSMVPLKVCTDCGTALGSIHVDSSTKLRGVRGADPLAVSKDERPETDTLLFQGLLEPLNGSEPPRHQGMDQGSEGLHPDQGTTAPDGQQGGLRDGAPAGHVGPPGSASDGRRGSASLERPAGRQQRREPPSDAEEDARPGAEALAQDSVPTLRRVGAGEKSCPACHGGSLRNGTVLDPFAGSGTTLMVATGHGRDAIGIDLDARNADLALDRVGPLMLTIEHHPEEAAS